MPGSIRRWRLVAVAIALTAIAGAVALAMFLPVAPVSPIVRATASPSATALPESPSQTAEPTAAPPATLNLEWTKTAVFGDESTGAIDAVEATRWSEGLIAVGAQYLGQVSIRGIRPPTRSGLIWLSADGRAWNDVTPRDQFSRIRLHEVFEAADGSLIVVGESWSGHWFGEEGPVEQFFRSVDGREWHEVPSPLPAWRYVAEVERGPLGYVLRAQVMKVFEVEREHRLSTTGTEIWFSEDGMRWEVGWKPSGHPNNPEYLRDIAAGADGFVAVGRRGSWHSTMFTITSLDGRKWSAPAAPAHAGVWQVAAHSPGWIIVATGPEQEPGVYLESLEEPATTIWSSLSGIAWKQIGTMGLPPTEVEGADCYGSTLSIHGAAEWLVASGQLYCEIGNAFFNGSSSPFVSLDGLEWRPLPIPGLTIDKATVAADETGLQVNSAIATETGLVLVGNSNGQATFWLGAPE